MNAELHAIADQNGRSLSFFMTAKQVSDCIKVSTLLDSLYVAQ